VFTDERVTVSKGRNQLVDKQYVASCQTVREFSEKRFCCAKEFGINDQTELIMLGDGARWITKLAQTQYPLATMILDWWHLDKRGWETVDWLRGTQLNEEAAVSWGRDIISSLWRGNSQNALTIQ